MVKRAQPSSELGEWPDRLRWYIDEILGVSRRSIGDRAAKYGLGSPNSVSHWINRNVNDAEMTSFMSVIRALHDIALEESKPILNVAWLLFEEGEPTYMSTASSVVVPAEFAGAMASLPVRPSSVLVAGAYALVRETKKKLTVSQWTRVFAALSHGEAWARDYIAGELPGGPEVRQLPAALEAIAEATEPKPSNPQSNPRVKTSRSRPRA